MQYISTRGAGPKKFTDILLEGLAPDGGLYLPASYPQVDAAQLEVWSRLLRAEGYAALAFEVIRLFVDDIPADDLRAICERAYRPEKFLHPDVVPVTRHSDGVWRVHLSNGPSAAFKDMAMLLLGELFAYELGRSGRELNILGATSGDTGSSAEYAMLGKPGVRVFMLSPAGRMSPFQQAQMFSIDDPAIVNIAVSGVFDDCQDIVKAVNADAEFKRRYSIGAVNSINWARLLAQIVYYFAAWLRITDVEGPAARVSFTVPSGNFGNVVAGHIAREMGLPLVQLVVATNENDVLEEFFTTGVYRPRAGALATSSPSMDISKASNFERFIFDVVGRDPERLRQLFVDDLGANGFFDLSADPAFAQVATRFGFAAGHSTHADRLATIRRIHAAGDGIVDPHTADGFHVAEGIRAPWQVAAVLETALPVKFADTIREAIGVEPERPERYVGIEQRPRKVTPAPNDAAEIKRIIAEVAG
ncbi:threonine synthase [Tessaracoccus sp. OH4464_COT-324]|uniref:threonine synthase n=1 Tax=Tessaracoccus sp. OH4464_COT-324 TaxID=2491059 RepID=UPI000F635A66|nr:threonine synthase [Tessaracoccus sp. OH4464_COT-324]RRD46070.1 threonine synthase [Tessaracoccus sp. OH4464_COT-324]